ncbi:prevent-host-death protein [Crocosphaera sp. XPORK-15E]|uniref:type II toxin-antitoxin system Phd/YefM family antitoxin n=1 Tax=Crocosphaera sp. XPORK-15E TaxID=3110247 RepID=UPI002B1FC564|nr:prevent-host-death protein [Crocosphaera sp. XPORK-15E]MEA5534414.1 prevent-host-death protein [Crocosphaera sp. XPORK-15E]
MNSTDIQYVSDEQGKTVAVIVPIDLWNDIASERETAYLMASPKNAERLNTAIEQLRSGKGIERELIEE